MSKFGDFQEAFKNKASVEKLRQAVRVLQPAEYLGSKVGEAIDLLSDWFKEQGYVFNLNFENLQLLQQQFDYGRATGIALMADAKKGEEISVGRFIAYCVMELRLAKEQAARLESQIGIQKRIFIEDKQAIESFIIKIYEDASTPEAIKDQVIRQFQEILPIKEEDND